MNLLEIFTINEKVKNLQEEVKKTQISYREELKKYILNYFNGNIPNVLALSKNQFLTGITERSFDLKCSESGIFWVVTGHLATVKDSSITYGHSLKTLYQGEYEVMPEELKNHTLEDAKTLTQPIFPIVPRVYHGVDYANIGYELARNENFGVILVWRKAATAYIDRSSGSKTSESELQILPIKPYSTNPDIRKNISILENNTQNETVKDWTKIMLSNYRKISIHIGGRLKKDLILEYTQSINQIFGVGTVSNIVMNIEKQSSRKKIKKNNENQEIITPLKEKQMIEDVYVDNKGKVLKL